MPPDMPMPAPATADSFLSLLDRSGLLPGETTDEYRAVTGSPRQVADALVRDKYITPFQSRQLLAGRHRGFFLTDKYKVLDLLGEGGMGRVLLVEHLILHKLQAVKVLTGAEEVPGAVERFLREARALAALDHPNIARVYDVDRTPTGPFLVMEYIDGTNLHQLVAQHGPVEPGRAAGFARQAALGLQHAHESGLIHRDIKPGNLMLDRHGTVKLLDLGLARFFDQKRNQNLTRRFDAKNILGTADFIAPEQAMNSSAVDIRADIYSLGCTLYYLLTAQFPYPDGQPLEKLQWHQNKPFAPVRALNPAVSEGLAAALDRMVQKDPGERYQSPEAVAEALSDFGRPPGPPPAAEMPRLQASAYRLGLSPPPSTTSFAASPTSPVRLSPSHDDLDLPPLTGDPGRTPRTNPTVAPTTLPTSARSAPTAIQPAAKRLAPWATAGLALAFAAAVGVWAVVVNRSPPVATPPTGGEVIGTGPDAPLVVSGSTFVRPLMDHWVEVYQKETGKRVHYEPVGSPRGVSRVTEQVAQVGLTDVALTDEQLRAAVGVGGPVAQVPLCLGAVAVAYTLPDAGAEPLRLSGPVLADLFRGRVERWDDPALKTLNPGRSLPATRVTPVRRLDGSGTTALFTRFLAGQVADWPPTAVGTAPQWPHRLTGDRGGDAVATLVGTTPGAVGYVEPALAIKRRLRVAEVENAAGRAVAPKVAGVAAAADGVGSLDELKRGLVGRPAAGAYPICGVTWAVVYEKVPGGKGAEAAAFLKWATTSGQKHVADLHYAPLPASLAGAVADAVGSVR